MVLVSSIQVFDGAYEPLQLVQIALSCSSMERHGLQNESDS